MAWLLAGLLSAVVAGAVAQVCSSVPPVCYNAFSQCAADGYSTPALGLCGCGQTSVSCLHNINTLLDPTCDVAQWISTVTAAAPGCSLTTGAPANATRLSQRLLRRKLLGCSTDANDASDV